MIEINGEKRCHETRSRFHLDRPRQDLGRQVAEVANLTKIRYCNVRQNIIM